jgi:hypothetical protein
MRKWFVELDRLLMARVLRPFVGTPGAAFSWFRTRESNFFEGVWRALVSLFS